MTRSKVFLAAGALAFLLPTSGYGQDGLEADLLAACETAGLSPELTALCLDVVTATQVFQSEAGLLLVGGNPVLGTASPIGARFRFIPRFNVGARLNFVFLDMPDILDSQSLEMLDFALPMPQFDVSVGLFDGFSLTPSLGGLLSLELLGSLSTVILPGGDGFQGDATGWGLGGRLGVLRESFTAPGISVSALYKTLDRVQFGDAGVKDEAEFGTDLDVISLRAGLSKSFVSFGLAAGLGWDRYESDVDLALLDPTGGVIQVIPEDDPVELTSESWSGFVDISYILLFFSFVAELGWQESKTLVTSTGNEIESGNFFGAIGVRLSL